MTMNAPYRIVVVGGGSAGWIAAAVMARFLPPERYAVTLVESDAIGIVGVGESTIPQIQLLNAALGIDEFAFMRATKATYKLGIEFVGWGAPDTRYIHAFGPTGRQIAQTPFQHFWLRGRRFGETAPLDAYSLNASAAYAGRFQRASGNPAQAPSELAHAFQFDAALYASMLSSFAQSKGVTRVEGMITTVHQDSESGDVTGVSLEDGRSIEGDLFIDCSGFRGLLIEQALATGYESWTRWLPCDRALALPSVSAPKLTPYTRATTQPAGWQWRIPLQHRVGNGHVYCSAQMSDDEAADRLHAQLDGAPIGEPRQIRFNTGRRKAFWRNNVVAIGLAAGFIEPLESTSIHLVQSAAERLLKYLPNGPIQPADVAAFNAQTIFEWERVRDFIILHYHVNARPEPFWRECATMSVPDSLTEKLELFRASGRINRFNEELFAEVGWLQVMVGQGIIPESYSPFADNHSEAEVAELLQLMRRTVTSQVAAMPTHEAFIERNCKAA